MATAQWRGPDPRKKWVDPPRAPWKGWKTTSRTGRCIRFVEEFCRAPSGVGAGHLIQVAAFQRDMLEQVLEDDSIDAAAISIPLKNGKTTLWGAVSAWALMDEQAWGDEPPEVIWVAEGERLAQRAMQHALNVIQASPELVRRCTFFGSDWRLVCPENRGVMVALPALESGLQGWNPTLALIDEFGFIPRGVWDAMAGRLGARSVQRLLGIGTPGVDRDIMWDLREAHQQGILDGMKWIEYAARPDCDPLDEAEIRRANPAIDAGFLDIDKVKRKYARIGEHKYRIQCLGQWPRRSSNAVFADGELEALPRCQPPDRDALVAFGFDGSDTEDHTALMACTAGTDELWTVNVWDPEQHDGRIPRLDVLATLRDQLDTYPRSVLVADPWGWRTELEELEALYPGRVFGFNTAGPKMDEVAERFLSAVRERLVRHDHDPRFLEHAANAVGVPTRRGVVIRKDRKGSPNKIDLVIAAILAWEWAHAASTPWPRPVRRAIH